MTAVELRMLSLENRIAKLKANPTENAKLIAKNIRLLRKMREK